MSLEAACFPSLFFSVVRLDRPSTWRTPLLKKFLTAITFAALATAASAQDKPVLTVYT